MSRTIHTFLPVPGEPDAVAARFVGDPAAWLPDARHTGPDGWELHVGAGPVDRPVCLTVGAPWLVGDTWWRPWSWTPLPDAHDPIAVERLLPVLDAELGLTRAGGQLTLVLDGRYHAPGGRAGDAIDAVALGRVARLTLQRLLAAIAVRLTAPTVEAISEEAEA